MELRYTSLRMYPTFTMKKTRINETIRLYWEVARKYRWSFLIVLIVVFLAGLTNMIGLIYLRNFFDAILTEGEKSVVIHGAVTMLLFFIMFELLHWLAWRINDFFVARAVTKTIRGLQDYTFDYIHQHSYDFYANNFVGSLVKKAGRFVWSFDRITSLVIFDFWRMILNVVIITVILLLLNVWLGVAIIGWVVLFLLSNIIFARFKLKFDMERTKADSKISAVFADTVTNNINVKLFAGLDEERKSFESVTKDLEKKAYKAWRVGDNIEAGQAMFMIVLEFVVLYIAVLLWGDGLIQTADFVLIELYLFEIFHLVWPFGRNVRDMYEAFSDAGEMTDILLIPHEIKDTKRAKELSVPSGKIEFRDVTFTYSKADDHVIRHFNLIIKPGQKVALIGSSGGGKTTITKLLLRLYDIQKGQILVDNQNIRNVTQNSLRRHIALVPQDPIMFHRSLMENIRYGRRDASDEEVMAASKLAYCHGFIRTFPKGYQTFVGERGVKLSGGQRQRVAIARAILSNAKILILDEATSSLDSESEVYIQKALENLIKNKTTIVIAHRLSTVMTADRILVLQDGKIVEDGRHSDLINKQGSMYGKMWDLQVSGYA